MYKFSLPASRNLSRYLGEMDAMVELTELAARSFISSAKESGDVISYVKSLCKQFNVYVNLSEINLLSLHLAQSYIVTVYQSAERFFHEFREEHTALYNKKWTGDRNDIDPLTLSLQNIGGSKKEVEDKIGLDIISRFQYYRILRNWVIHKKDSDSEKPINTFDEIVKYTPKHKALFGSTDAPNKPSELTFDDFILFSRLTKHIAETLCEISCPHENHWKEFLLPQFKNLCNNRERMKRAVAARLRTEYGMDEETAKWISSGV